MMASTAFAESLEYKAGRAAGNMKACDRQDIVKELDQIYELKSDYLRGRAKLPFFGGTLSYRRWNLASQQCSKMEKEALTFLPHDKFISAYDGVSNGTICKNGLLPKGVAWNTLDPFVGGYISEAKSRGLSERDCARILD